MSDQIEIEGHLYDAYVRARLIRDQAQSDMKAIRARLIALYDDGDDELEIHAPGGEFVGTFNRVESQKFDATRFKKDYPDIYNQYSTLASTRTLKLESPHA